jgi:hypothetical protein
MNESPFSGFGFPMEKPAPVMVQGQYQGSAAAWIAG